MSSVPLGFQPTPAQAGHAIGLSVFHMTSGLWNPLDMTSLDAAGLSSDQYQGELLLVCAAAAMHAIEAAELHPEIETQVASGLFEWARELPQHLAQLLLSSLDEATDSYAEASALDQESPRSVSDFSEVECAFADRLLAKGEDNEVRGRACCLLSLALPKTLWAVQFRSARSMLGDAGLIAEQ